MPNNHYGQPVGFSLSGWTERDRPSGASISGQYCHIEKLDAGRHAAELWEAYCESPDARDWTYLFAGPFADFEDYAAALQRMAASLDPFHYAIIDAASGKAAGTAAYMRIDPPNGVIEIGSIAYSQRLQRKRAGTEAIYLLMRRALDELGYRRCEWKCDSLNAPSRAAAERYGFSYDGLFRRAIIYKGRNRDTAWYSVIDEEWPAIRPALQEWLSPANFDTAGKQFRSLRAIRDSIAAGGRRMLELDR